MKARILLVDDHGQFRQLARSFLDRGDDFEVIAEAKDGLEAVRVSNELNPDVIVLDIGLPGLNGFEVAKRIAHLAPRSKILFFSQESSVDLVKRSFEVGGCGYVVKSDAATDLLPAVHAVLRGSKFLGNRFSDALLVQLRASAAGIQPQVAAPVAQRSDNSFRHEVLFYRDDAAFQASFGEFIATNLRIGNTVIAVATEAHRQGLWAYLKAMDAAIIGALEQGKYISIDSEETVEAYLVNGVVDPARVSALTDSLMATVGDSVGSKNRVVACGESAPLLWARGDVQGALQLERLWHTAASKYGINVLCAYSTAAFEADLDGDGLNRVCAEHSAIYRG